MEALVTSFVLIFTSEMGDKSQLMSMAFATLFKVRTVLISIFIAALINNGIAVIFGSYITEYIPIFYIKFLAALLFLFFGISTLIEKETKQEKIKNSKYGPVATIISTYVLSEFGDKTQLAAIALTASYNSPLYILIGTTLGIFLADILGIIVGIYFNKKFPSQYLKYLSSFIFIAFGLSTLYKLFF
ncbi:putative membrane protein [Thermoanaerobacter kivui]|uniref:GDT1 family protein n=1 Tax=Thermoanaerobacter kivui TaxID=2325 RepID=A0A097AR14_THEKI|nr:TMEM165/GDT1 family protein [Thermoanaerobacter kivui]AIS52266.1 putative membrane protein [Thermoanaerobacter kivui]